MSSTQLAPAFRQQFFDSNGLPLNGGQVFTYAAGTTTPQATYTDETGNTPNTNPIVLDSSGKGSIWIGSNAYKFVIEDSLNNVIQTVDNVQSPLSRDVNGNFSANNFIEGYATTPTAAATTTLLVGSSFQQYFTGSTTQTVLLPVVSTLVLGQQFIITNQSTGVVTVQSSGANTIQAMAANSQLIATCIAITGTGTASWSWVYNSFIQNIAANSILGNNTGSPAIPLALTGTQTTAMLNVATNSLQGLVPAWPNDVTKFFRSDGTYAVPSGPTGSYAQAYFAFASSWSTVSSTFVDPTNSGGNALTVRQYSGITLTAAASNLPGITFTPASASAVYLISAQVGSFNSTVAGGVNFQMTDGSTIISGSPGWEQGAISAAVLGTTLITGVYIPGTTSSVTVKIQLATNTVGTAEIMGENSLATSIEWTVVRIA